MRSGMSHSRQWVLQGWEWGSTVLKNPPVSLWPTNASLMQDLGLSAVGEMLEEVW